MIMATTKDRKRLKLGRSVMKINESTLAFEHTDPDELRALKNCASTHSLTRYGIFCATDSDVWYPGVGLALLFYPGRATRSMDGR